MMPTDRFDRQLPVLLDELAQPRTPDYFDDLLRQTARTRQRPDWTIPERWLPMVDIARQPVIAPRIPLRTIGTALLLIGLLVAALAAVVIGTRPKVPPPFGPARNGLVAYAKDGDIYTVDPVTGSAVPIVTGPGIDEAPLHSLDGTHIAFQRGLLGGLAQIYVARSDGRGVRIVTPSPLVDLGGYVFSPDGSEVMFQSTMDGAPAISFAKTDGSRVRTLELGIAAYWPAYRPPHGNEIAFAGAPNGGPTGLYTVHTDDSGLRTLVAPSDLDVFAIAWAPDGSRIAYAANKFVPAGGPMSGTRIHVFSVAESTDRVVTPPPGVDWEGVPLWSNNGTRLLIWRCHSSAIDPGHCEQSSAVIPADGSGFGVDLDGGRSLGVEGASQQWAPDDRSILTTALDPMRQPKGGSLLWDPATGASRTAPWAAPDEPSWQRLAP
jgi:dipeptidyl aminopeptidase/acylaminoacyl peptidase